jgi:hypothetical protein
VTLCGHTIRLNYTGAPDSQVNGTGHLIDAFPDDDICWACVRALGDLSHLAFAHPQTEDRDDGSLEDAVRGEPDQLLIPQRSTPQQ